ncbi:TPA: hypothetical protein DEO28_02150 [Candidatus Dependentiae bacterium]|nr:MAG: hypothetical protein UR14_C0009G0023 [candidate division TM6 bacterium GW2011_GWE2_31_21]KKP52536.1 MAG: hypothetical protein UR43_C0012G0005 [candidate division TM6 bacterium GW2011_GWF2_33_332]HBS48442.1 hypothetical protein [Candidatus Dependentiae bacterium]HBZ73291.1 hypothetical protein [Candidatus Dependentiae bacterium]
MFKKINLLLFLSFSLPNLLAEKDWYGNSAESKNSKDFTYVVSSFNETGFEISEAIKEAAKKKNGYLNESKLFDAQIIKDTKAVKKILKENVKAEECYTKTIDGVDISYSYIARGGDNVIIVAPGFTNAKETMAPFVEMFWNNRDCDIVLMNFRGHGDLMNKSKDQGRLNNFFKKFLEVDLSVSRFGFKEEEDIFAVVKAVKEKKLEKDKKQYKKVIGLGVCYGAMLMAKAQGLKNKEGEKLFSDLILDGCWLSLKSIIDNGKNNMALFFDPQHGGSKWGITSAEYCITAVLQRWPVQMFLMWQVSKLSDNKLNDDIRVTTYLPNIKDTNVLMFYSRNDLVISRDYFETIWETINVPKAVVITSNPHVRNHLKQKELYKFACDNFIAHGPQFFVESQFKVN